MCGIFACVGVSDAMQCVFQGLKRLEYRGYDSWGVVGIDLDKLVLKKQAGKISDESNFLPNKSVKIALGHTRWATHGGVTDTNAHPHLAKSGKFAVVQNGVVENYQDIKADLEKSGYEFITQTDTEVIVGLLERELENSEQQAISRELVSRVFEQLDGRNTIAVIDTTGRVVALRNGSPLVLGTSDGSIFISSDTLSLSHVAEKYLALHSGQGVEIAGQEWHCFDIKSGSSLDIELQDMNLEAVSLDHQGFDSFMEKEIFEQAEVLSNILREGEGKFAQAAEKLKNADSIYLVAAGSASFVAGQISWYLRRAGLRAFAIPAYEADSLQSIASDKDCVIAISQSGETADTNEVVEKFREVGAYNISVVNMAGSTLSTQLSDLSFMLGIGPEIAVASTKALTAQMLWGWVVSELISESSFSDIKAKVTQIEQILSKWLEQSDNTKNIQKLAEEIHGTKNKDLFILGRGELYYPALEAALKLKEIGYVHAEGFSGGELKHGVIALIEPGTPVICFVDDDSKAEQLNAAAEVKARGGRIIGVAFENNQLFDRWIEVARFGSCEPISFLPPIQLLSCYLAKVDGRNPDKPRNLAKSVTVK